ILCARAGALSQYAFCPVRFERTVPVPSDHTFLIASSGIAAHKTSNALDSYNRVASLAHAAFAQWRAVSGCAETTLGAAARAFRGGFDDTQAALGAAMERAPRGSFDAGEMTERLVQFVMESEEIVLAAGDALAEGRLGDLGVLVDRSMANAERMLHNQVKETVFLARRARELGATAASAFGAGFGGSVWALVPRSAADEFTRQLMSDYAAWSGRRPTGAEFFLTDAGPSVRQV
ncbi:MAG TPA: hypothetical protein VMH39_06710, partial [Gemmatimonadaceae bacterium]|nr:hypothetical protein [Gemmatimonadaceae bacterium]